MEDKNFNSLLHMSKALTNERLTQALTDKFEEPVTFTHWEYVGDTGKGDSYLSEVMRIKIYGDASGESKHVQVIVKTIPKNVCRRLTYKSDEFFKNEINFYRYVIPGLLKFESVKNVSDSFKSFTKLFFSFSDGINDVICLEDVSLDDYVSAVRQEGIDYEHCKITLRTMARFHAISFAMRDQEPETFDKLSDYIFETYYDPRLWDWYRKFFARICGIAIDAVEKEYPNSIYLQKIKEFAVPETYQRCVRAVRDGTNRVISHGDSWTNNYLYKYKDGIAVDAKIFDFQICRSASPILDISFVFYGCTDQQLRLQHYDELINYYYEVLSERIAEMGSDPHRVYSHETFMKELKMYSFFGLAFSFESTPFIILAPEDAISMEMPGNAKKNIDEFWSIQPIKSKAGRQREANNIVHCVDLGYI